ncbi:hypothetical protein AB0J28_30205 [Streptosporangium canum]|uniref:hypothetical protein n=1 Tax=Streptosporangium canum TaxID=324952 RepID=UPI003425D843
MAGQTMTKALELPLHMRRNGLNPVEELAWVRDSDSDGAMRVETPLGLPAYLICRQEDVRQVPADPARFSSALTPFPGPGQMNADELATMQAGQLIGSDPPEHTRLRRILTRSSRYAGRTGSSHGSPRSPKRLWTIWSGPAHRPTRCRTSRCRCPHR